MPSCFAYTPAKPAKNGQEETALLLNFGGSCFVCCCVYFNRYARSVKVTVRVLPGQLPVSPENAGAGTSIKLLYVVVLLSQTAICCVFISGVQNRAENLITEVMVPRCVHGTMRGAAECTTFVLPIAQRCHRAGVPPGPFRQGDRALDSSCLAMALASPGRFAGRQPQAAPALGADRLAGGLLARAAAAASRRATRLTGQRPS